MQGPLRPSRGPWMRHDAVRLGAAKASPNPFLKPLQRV